MTSNTVLRYIEVRKDNTITQYGPYANKRAAEGHLRDNGWHRIVPMNPPDGPAEYSKDYWMIHWTKNPEGMDIFAKVKKLELHPRNLLPRPTWE